MSTFRKLISIAIFATINAQFPSFDMNVIKKAVEDHKRSLGDVELQKQNLGELQKRNLENIKPYKLNLENINI